MKKISSPGLFASQKGSPQSPKRVSSHRIEVAKFHAYRGVFFVALLFFILFMTKDFLKPLLMGAIFATVLYPYMAKFPKLKVSKSWRAVLLVLLFSLCFLLPIGILLVKGVAAAIEKIDALQQHGGPDSYSFTGIMDYLGLRENLTVIEEYLPFSEAQIRDYAIRGMKAVGAYSTAFLQSVAAGIPDFIISTFIILIAIYFFLIDGHVTLKFVRENSFFDIKKTDHLIETARSLCSSVVVATIATGGVHGTLMGIACLVTKTPNAGLWALITFFCSFLPVIGTAPVSLFMILSNLFMGNTSTAIIFTVFGVVIGLADNVVRPWVLKGGSSMHPLIGFIAAFGGLASLGFYGVFIGPIIAGLFFEILPIIAQSYGTEKKT